MRVGTVVGGCVARFTATEPVLHALWKPMVVLFSSVSACDCVSGRRGVQPSLRCYATSSARQALSNTCARTWMHSAVCPERDRRKPWKLQDTLSRRATARAASGGLRLLLVSTRSSASEAALRRHCTRQDPISTTGERSVKNSRKMPVTALVHTENGPPVSGFRTGVLCVFEPLCIFQNI